MHGRLPGDRVEAVVDTGKGVQTFDIVATRAGRRIEVTTARGIVEVTEVTRGGTPVRTGRFMASRLVALVEHPAVEADTTGVDITTRRRIAAPDDEARGRRGRSGAAEQPGHGRGRRPAEAEPLALDLGAVPEPAAEPDPIDLRREAERRRERDDPS
jgi:hypothetical protein